MARRRTASRSPSGLGSPASRPVWRPVWCRRPRPRRAPGPEELELVPGSASAREAAVSSPAAQAPLASYDLPDWTDPPTLQVPRILLDLEEEAAAERGGPPTPPRGGPVWRERQEDWDDTDAVLADLASAGPSVTAYEESSSEDPFAYDFLELDDESSWIAREVGPEAARPARRDSEEPAPVVASAPAPPRPAEPAPPPPAEARPAPSSPAAGTPVVTSPESTSPASKSRLFPGSATGTGTGTGTRAGSEEAVAAPRAPQRRRHVARPAKPILPRRTRPDAESPRSARRAPRPHLATRSWPPSPAWRSQPSCF